MTEEKKNNEEINKDMNIKEEKDHKDKKADNSRKIWTVLTFLIWYDRFFTTCSK